MKSEIREESERFEVKVRRYVCTCTFVLVVDIDTAEI